ncbi:hypothetical protein M0802_005939 [Mischocyttarus mexicanus]|nr:hypothetical protein M0802_005939 [Mischocyttarus mexicanus]
MAISNNGVGVAAAAAGASGDGGDDGGDGGGSDVYNKNLKSSNSYKTNIITIPLLGSKTIPVFVNVHFRSKVAPQVTASNQHLKKAKNAKD